MMLPSPTPFTGSLYTRKQASADIALEFCSRVAELQIAGQAEGGWTHMVLTSGDALLRGIEEASHYPYDFLVRPGKASRFLLVSTHGRLAELLLERAGMQAHTSRQDVGIPALVHHLVREPGRYVMSVIYARTDGHRDALRSISFFGVDVGEAELFKRLLEFNEITPFRVTLRDVVAQVEIISIGSKGEVAFTYSGPNSLRDADLSLRFLSERGYLQWEAE